MRDLAFPPARRDDPSAHDVGWVRESTVGRLVRRDVRTVPTDLRLSSFRREVPLGSTQRVIAVDEADRMPTWCLSRRHTSKLLGSSGYPTCCNCPIEPCWSDECQRADGRVRSRGGGGNGR